MMQPELYKTKTLDPGFKKLFLREIAYFVKHRKEPSYLEIILELCEKHEVEPESVAGLLTQPIRERLEVEATNLNFLPKSSCTQAAFSI